MFLYHTSKAMIWGHAFRPKDPVQARDQLNSFFDQYFERIEPDEQNGTRFLFKLNWKNSALPNAEWPEQFLKPDNKHLSLIMFTLTEDRISFPLGIIFPIPLKDPASYDFLRKFSSTAPFKMTAQHFSIVIPVGKKGRYAARKPDAETAARLNELIP